MQNLEHLSPGQFAKVTDTLGRDLGGQEIAAAWIGKEKLRRTCAPTSPARSRASATSAAGSPPSKDWYACNDDIPELVSLARTVSRWGNEIVAAVPDRNHEFHFQSLNRLAKLEARQAYGFRNPASQRRHIRIACTRGTRRRSRNATATKTRLVTRRQHDPG